MNQLSLFEQSNHDGHRTVTAKPIARRTDPETSHKAAAHVDLKGNRKLFFETLAGWSNIPRTANEVAVKAIPFDDPDKINQVSSKRETLRKRAKSLVDDRWIAERGERSCTVTGNNAMTYETIRKQGK